MEPIQKIIYLMRYLVKRYNMRITNASIEELRFSLRNTSLLSIIEILDTWNIKSQAGKLNALITELPLPFITQQLTKHKDYIIVTKITSTHVTYFHPTKRELTVTHKQFEMSWSRICLFLDGVDNAFEADFDSKRSLEKQNTIKSICVNVFPLILYLSISYLHFQQLSGTFHLLFFLNLIGFWLTNIQADNPYKINWYGIFCKPYHNSCKSFNYSINVRVIGKITFSSLAQTYFLTILIVLLLSVTLTDYNYSFITVLSTIALPIIFYSLYLQKFIFNAWCRVCLIIGTLVAIDFTLSIRLIEFQFSMKYLLLFGIVFSTLIVFNKINELILQQNQKINFLTNSLLLFKRDIWIFNNLLDSSALINDYPSRSQDIKLGPDNAKFEVIFATTPSCQACIDSFQILNNLRLKYPQEIRIKFKFCVLTRDSATNVTNLKRLIGLVLRFPTQTSEFINSYFTKSIDQYSKFFQTDLDGEVNRLLDEQAQWFETNNIVEFPAIIYNTKLVPSVYSIVEMCDHLESTISKELKN